MRRVLLGLLTTFLPVTGLSAHLPPALRNIIPTPQQIQPNDSSFYLVRDGQAAVQIVMPDDPEPKVSLAAEYLSKRVAEIAGVALPTVTEAQFGEGAALFLAEAGDRLLVVPWAEPLSPEQQEQEYNIAPLGEGQGYVLRGHAPLGTLEFVTNQPGGATVGVET